MKIVFAGTPQFAVNHLECLLENNFEIDLVLTRPDKRSGRGNKLKISGVKLLAEREGIQFLQPRSLVNNKELIAQLKIIKPDLILVVAYGLILTEEILALPKLGCINIHASLLPRWRGASPIEYSIMNGDRNSGITFMKMEQGLDTGPILEQHQCKISSDESSESLEKKLILISKKVLPNFLCNLSKGLIKESQQDSTKASYAYKIDTKMAELNWEETSAKTIDQKIRALSSRSGAFTYLEKKRIKIEEIEKANWNGKRDNSRVTMYIITWE